MQRNDSKRTSLRDTGDVETPESKLLDPQNALEQCERTDNNLLVDVLEYDESESEEFVDYDSSDDNLFTMSKLPKVQEEDKYSDEDDKVDNDEDTDDVGFRTTYGDGLDECVPIPLNEDIVQTTNEDNSETTTTGYEEAVLQRMNSFVVEDASNSSFSVHTPPTARGSLKSTRITGNSLPNISSEDNSGRFTRSTFSRVMSVRKSRLDDDRSSHRRSKSNVKDTELCRSSSGRSACRTTSRGDDDSSSNSSSARRSSIISSFRKSRLGPKFSFRSTSSDDSIRKSRSSHHRIENRSSNPIEFDKNATASAAESVRIISVQIPARRGVQFGFGEFVLVQLSRLSVSELDKDFGTVSPVNKFGYPIGEGKTEKQKHGPYKYVLCSIRQVHFDEDERYYTVKRLDTGAEQRADLGFDWMEPIRNYDDIEVAMKAAKHSKNSAAENEGKDKERVSLLWSLLACPLYYFDEVVRPFYKESRQATKVFLAHMLHGDHKYACNIRFTGINFLVLCSVAYLFLDVVVLAFVDAEHDHVAAIVGM